MAIGEKDDSVSIVAKVKESGICSHPRRFLTERIISRYCIDETDFAISYPPRENAIIATVDKPNIRIFLMALSIQYVNGPIHL
jgi:hypothetical protein